MTVQQNPAPIDYVAAQTAYRQNAMARRQARGFGNAKRVYRLARKHEHNAVEHSRHARALLEEYRA